VEVEVEVEAAETATATATASASAAASDTRTAGGAGASTADTPPRRRPAPWLIAAVLAGAVAAAYAILPCGRPARPPVAAAAAVVPDAATATAAAAAIPDAATAAAAVADASAEAEPEFVVSTDPVPPSQPSRAHPRREPPAAAAVTGTGFFTVDSRPFATVYIDGKRVGVTPILRLSLPAGPHTVRAISQTGAEQTLRVVIEAGKEAPRRRLVW
jgi:serine/threonine-protein kinase